MTNPATAPQLQITVNPAAPEELQHIGLQYWQYTGDLKALEWVSSAHEIDYSSWATNARFAAGAGVTATLTGYSCSTCNGPMELSGRSKVGETLRGKETKCRHCINHFTTQVNHVLDPDYHAQRVDMINRERREREAREERRLRAAQLEQRRQAVLKQRAQRLSDGTFEQALEQASILTKIGTLLWLQRHLGLNIETSRLEFSLVNRAWEEGLLTISSRPQTSHFTWDKDDPANLTGLEHFSSLDLGHQGSGTEKERVYTTLLSDLTQGLLADEEVNELRWLLPHIVATEAAKALQTVEVEDYYGLITSTVRLTIAQRDALTARVQQAAHVASLHDIVIAMQSAVYHAQEQDNDEYDEWLTTTDVKDTAMHAALNNLQMLQAGNTDYLHQKADTDDHEITHLTSLIFIQCLNLNPLSPSTTPQAIENVLASRASTDPDHSTVELTLDPDTLSQAKEYAHSNNLTLGTIIENALKSYFT